MEIQYVLKIHKVDVYNNFNNFTNVIYNLRWEIIGEYTHTNQKTYRFGIDRHTKLNIDNITNFIPIEQITKEILQEWLLQSININRFKDAIKEEILKMIERDNISTISTNISVDVTNVVYQPPPEPVNTEEQITSDPIVN